MSAAVPPSSTSPSSATSPARVAASSAPPSELPRGEVRDVGAVRKDSVSIERWSAHGLVKVTGDVRVGDGSLQGTVAIAGAVSAASLRYQGTVGVGGLVDVRERLVGSGALRTSLALHAGEADLKGTVRTVGAVSVDRMLRVRGTLECPSLAVGRLDLEGQAEVSGDTTTPAVSAHLLTSSHFGTIRAQTVRLRAKIPNLVEKILSRDVEVTVDRIEAESVELEAVDVDFVRAPEISLGRNAHVTQYEGTIVRRHRSSRVGFESRSPPPYGLSR